MLKGRLLTILAAALLILGMGFGVVRLIGLRLEKGDIYPAYSTLRADPLGSKALFDALESIEGREVRRNFRPLRELRPTAPVTLMYVGVPTHAAWGKGELQHFESLIANGSRAVFAFVPASLNPERERPAKGDADKEVPVNPVEQPAPIPEGPFPPAPEKKKSEEKPSDKAKEDEKKSPSFPGESTVSFQEVAERWGLKLDVATGKKAGSFHGLAKLADGPPDLESELSWHSALRFKELKPNWRVLYRAAGQPVVIERQWGDGTIVFASDAFFLSNEGLQTEPATGFVAWLLGSPGTVVFDEEHLGVSESTGIVSLIRKYRIQGALAALVLVAILWFWMESSPLIPPRGKHRAVDEYVTGLDSQEGFVSLLRRTIAPARVFEMCVEEWRKTFSHDSHAVAGMDAALASGSAKELRPKNSASAYREVAAALHRHSHPSKSGPAESPAKVMVSNASSPSPHPR